MKNTKSIFCLAATILAVSVLVIGLIMLAGCGKKGTDEAGATQVPTQAPNSGDGITPAPATPETTVGITPAPIYTQEPPETDANATVVPTDISETPEPTDPEETPDPTEESGSSIIENGGDIEIVIPTGQSSGGL